MFVAWVTVNAPPLPSSIPPPLPERVPTVWVLPLRLKLPPLTVSVPVEARVAPLCMNSVPLFTVVPPV